ncbi:hypothetical protein IMCC3317_17640 [Kordia antarctica]|uniref:ATPase AAA-type core domain-containing protein n=1 Tax=Kordia antarctica TaxID=1218801 RepID=A0A7L4ZIR6_9FLAO|nr:ATP-binding protein [Kordia antarctica]QHI36401.1 hypothetical protein IMCC3317_17640 [Kordia antarctica]
MKQEVHINRPLNFNSLPAREFEEMVYHYFKDRIEKGFYKNVYDNAVLSSGVGEKGTDSILFLNGKVKAIVQCKRLQKNIGINLVLSEVLKFLLYHILEVKQNNKTSSSLIYDIEDFTYFIVASKDFTQKAKIFLADFKNKWQTQDVQKLLKKELTAKSFKSLKIENILPSIEELLNKLNIKMISAVDLDMRIRSNTDIMSRYFTEIKFSPTIVEKKNTLSDEQLISKAKFISNDITRVKAYFGKDETLNIIRPVRNSIINWVLKDLNENEMNIAVVSGNAGMGKTVVISQVYDKLIEDNIPVLSLKADRLTFTTIKELEDKLDIETSFLDFFTKFIGEHKTGVLLIDQIDALSQALSSNMKPLRFYDNLIQKFIGNPKVKIILSTRIYDLNYDPIISNYKGKKEFIIKELDKNTLLEILEKSDIKNISQFSDSFLKLLAVPLHLDVFLKIYSAELKLDEIKSLQDLYNQLWKYKILLKNGAKHTHLKSSRITKLIYEIAVKMYDTQQINIPELYFEDSYYDELNYLKSEGIIKGEDKIEFFHQSFFDYSFARNFVNNDINLTEDITSRHQGLFIRSKVKQIINYIRNVDPDKYSVNVIELLENKSIRFHLKLLVIQQIAFQDEPNILEQNIVKEIILKEKLLKDAFLSSYLGKGWLTFFIKNEIFRTEIEAGIEISKDQIIDVFKRFIFTDQNDILLEYYQSLKNSDIKDELIIDYLWRIIEVKNPLAIELIENVFKRNLDFHKEYWFHSILENAVKNFPEWVKNQVISNTKIKKGTSYKDREDYFFSKNHGSQLYETFWKTHSDIAYNLVKTIIGEIITKRSYELQGIIFYDQAFESYNGKNDSFHPHYEQLNELVDYLKETFLNNTDFVKNEVNYYLNSNYNTHIIIALSIINEFPEFLIEEAYSYFSDLKKFTVSFRFDEYLNYLLLDTFGKAYHLFTDSQRNYLNSHIIPNFYKDYEVRLIIRDNGEKVKNKFYGYTKYELLVSIKNNGNIHNKRLLKKYQELQRKFGEIEIKEPKETLVFVNRDVLEDANYNSFSDENWKASFKKYTHKNKSFNNWKHPSEFEHERKFSAYVSENPKKYLSLIEEIIFDDSISTTYVISGLEGLKNGQIEVDKLFDLFLKTITQRDINNDYDKSSLIRLVSYFPKHKKIYLEVLEFLKENALHGDEGKINTENIFNTGISSVRGAAANALIDYSFSEDTFDFICSTLELLVDNIRPSTRAAIIYELQYLIRHDKDRILNLFLNLSKDFHSGILKVSINPLQYLIHHGFSQLIVFFEQALKVKEADNEIGLLITIGFCNNYKGSEQLLNDFIIHNKPNSCVKTALEFIEKESKISGALKIVNRFLDIDDEELGGIYNRAFYHMNPKIFTDIEEFLENYVISEVGRYREYPFYDFLQKSTNDYPHKCIALAGKYKTHLAPDITKRHVQNEPLKVIINAYNAIREYDKKNRSLENAMDIFDDILQNDKYRDSSAFEVLRDIDSY